MKNKSIQIGNGAYVPTDNISYIVVPGSAAYKRKLEKAQAASILVDTTAGKKTRALIFLKTGEIIKSVLSPDTIANRFNKEENTD